MLDDWKRGVEDNGYTVYMRGNWFYAQKNGEPVDLIYIKTQKSGVEYGYKSMSVTCVPFCYSAPLWMVLKVHPLFCNDRGYKEWLESYPKKNNVLVSDRETFTLRF